MKPDNSPVTTQVHVLNKASYSKTKISLYLKSYLQKKFFSWHNVILRPKTTTPFLEEGNILAQVGREAAGNLWKQPNFRGFLGRYDNHLASTQQARINQEYYSSLMSIFSFIDNFYCLNWTCVLSKNCLWTRHVSYRFPPQLCSITCM